VSFKNYGDRAPAVRITASSSGLTFISDTVYTRVGDLIVVLQSFGVDPLDALEPVVKSAVSKIKAGELDTQRQDPRDPRGSPNSYLNGR
jgi:hypothetical protein